MPKVLGAVQMNDLCHKEITYRGQRLSEIKKGKTNGA